MKKLYILIYILLLIMITGCIKDPTIPSGNAQSVASGDGLCVTGEDSLSTSPPFEQGSPDFTETKKFLTITEHGCSTFEGWMYYFTFPTFDLRRCTPDLSQDTIVLSSKDYYCRSAINQEGYCILKKRDPSRAEFYIKNVLDGSIETINLPSTEGINNLIYYKNEIFFLNKLINIYNRNEGFIKTIEDSFCNEFAVIDDEIYFLPIYNDIEKLDYNNTVMCYSITKEIVEGVFAFEIQIASGYTDERYLPHIYYNNRNIIVRNNFTSFVYTSIDDIDPKKVNFDFSQSRWDIVLYIPSDDEDLYFEMSCFLGGDERNPITRSEYYKVTQGTGEPVLLKEFKLDGISVFFLDGYLYYLDNADGDNKMKREMIY